MRYSQVQGVERPISRLVQGTLMINSEEQERSFDLLDEVYALGCTSFDTAHQYGRGDSERTVGGPMKAVIFATPLTGRSLPGEAGA
jgi:aryl-alcohol dehydrogenase-like predicted oxidoreductase